LQNDEIKEARASRSGRLRLTSDKGKVAKIAACKGRLNIRAASSTFTISETSNSYQSKRSDENVLIADWLVDLTSHQCNWGVMPCFLNVKGFRWNHKRVYRIYCERELKAEEAPVQGKVGALGGAESC